MRNISSRKIIAVIMVVVLLSQLHHIIRAFSILSEFCYKALAPYREVPDELKYVINVAAFLIVFAFLWKIFISK